MITMTTARALGQATKWQVSNVEHDEKGLVAAVTVQLLNAANIVISQKTFFIRDNGLSDKLDYNTSPQAGQVITDALVYTPNVLNTPTGYSDAFAAWKTGSTPAARQSALESHLLTVGYMGSTLAGS